MTTAADGERSGDERPDQPAEDQWVFLIDPAWQPAASTEDVQDDDAERVGGTGEPDDDGRADEEGQGTQEIEGPPLEAVVGGWQVAPDGMVGRFSANPAYRPSRPGSPTDPVDATLQLVARAEADADALFAVIRESVFDVALDEQGRPLIAPSPDDVPSLLVSTAPAQRFRVHTEHWRAEVTAQELAELLREHDVDVLFNPGGPASIRLLGAVFAENVSA
jgi:hypothetical protein